MDILLTGKITIMQEQGLAAHKIQEKGFQSRAFKQPSWIICMDQPSKRCLQVVVWV